MIIYEAFKSEFPQDIFEDKLIDNIVNNYADKVGRIIKVN